MNMTVDRMTRPKALELEGISVRIGDAQLLKGVTLDIEPGQIVALVGANGAGKTTMLDAICGEVEGVTGTVRVGGEVIARRAGSETPKNVGRVFQGSPLPDTLTVAEVAVLAAGNREGALALMKRFGLTLFADTFITELSTGMRRIVDLSVAAANNPSLLILDEPASGLAQSEVDQLAKLLLKWRDESGGSVLIVEHDVSLLRRISDDVIVLNAGEMIDRGAPEELLGGHKAARTRVKNPFDDDFRQRLTEVAHESVKPVPPPRRTASTWTILRLGLREFSAGLSAVMILGVLNRVMRVEFGISLLAVSVILSTYNLAAPIALPIGHLSDRRPIFGQRRVPYIIGGSLFAGAAVIGAPYVADMLARGVTVFSVVASVSLFVVMGVGMYGAGAVFFALLADITSEEERGAAASLVYFELMAGILFGVAIVQGLVDDDGSGLKTLFAVVGVLIPVLSAVATIGQEKRSLPHAFVQQAEVKFRVAVKKLAGMSQARIFFIFMVVATIFLFLQQSVLEPFGGEVLGLTISQTSAFNGMMTAGILLGMWLGGRPWASQIGYLKLAKYGLISSVVAFLGLAWAAAASAMPPSWFSIFFIGLATGLFNVATLALMMGMADPRRTALFMGTWTMAHAIADGTAVAGGGVLFEAARAILNSVPGGYATVFVVEAVGLALCLPILAKIDPDKFREEALT